MNRYRNTQVTNPVTMLIKIPQIINILLLVENFIPFQILSVFAGCDKKNLPLPEQDLLFILSCIIHAEDKRQK